MDNHDSYKSPLASRYCSKEMKHIFSDDFKYKTWRECWVALAETQLALDVPSITKEMVDELRRGIAEPIDYDAIKAKEREVRHDVVAHAYEFGLHCPKAKGIIHNGATSMFVNDNTDLIQMREGMKLVRRGLVNALYNMSQIADEQRELVTLGYTHYQPAQPVTMGKRFAGYAQDLLTNLGAVESIRFMARGAKGTTGTQASYMRMFDGDFEKVDILDRAVANKLGFMKAAPITTQTYSRLFDAQVMFALAGIGISLGKFAGDMRLMSHDGVVSEPFGKNQVGSSAMPYKRNPMRSERITALSRDLRCNVAQFSETAANQWLERSLDDSAIRRRIIPEAFLSTDAILTLANNITDTDVDSETTIPLTFYDGMIDRELNRHLPFMVIDDVLVDLVGKGHDRQEMHEVARRHMQEVGDLMKNGGENDLFDRLAEDEAFPLTKSDLESYLSQAKSAGAAPKQVDRFLTFHVRPILAERKELLGAKYNVQV